MAEKKFYLESQSDLQRIGLRAQVGYFLLADSCIDKANVVNDSSDRKRVIVAVSVKFEPSDATKETEKINEIKKDLLEYLNSLSQVDKECYDRIPNDITATELCELNNPHALCLLDMQRLASSLMLEQTGKGVGVMLNLPGGIKESIKGGFEEGFKGLHTDFKDLSEEIAKLSTKIK